MTDDKHTNTAGAKVYAKQAGFYTYILVDENGDIVDKDGKPIYHIEYFHGQADKSGYPVYTPKAK